VYLLRRSVSKALFISEIAKLMAGKAKYQT